MENIAYCGLYCGNCPNQTGLVADLARNGPEAFEKGEKHCYVK